LRPFAREVSIEYVRDAEARRAAINLFLVLEGVGWKVTMVPRDEIRTADGIEVEPLGDGVEVEYFMAPVVPPWKASFTDMWEEELDSWNAAEAVVNFLHSYNWRARIGWPVNEKGEEIHDPKIFPPRSLRIKVGLYPAVIYVSPSGAKAFAEVYKQFEQENDKMLAQIRPREAEAEKRFLAQLTPKQAAVFKARKDHLAKMRKQREGQFSGPCQPLMPNPFPQHP
ncbi:MAG: hypothetical protein WA185_16055, partial [Candidatus Acidiferrales bacterium]